MKCIWFHIGQMALNCNKIWSNFLFGSKHTITTKNDKFVSKRTVLYWQDYCFPISCSIYSTRMNWINSGRSGCYAPKYFDLFSATFFYCVFKALNAQSIQRFQVSIYRIVWQWKYNHKIALILTKKIQALPCILEVEIDSLLSVYIIIKDVSTSDASAMYLRYL